jgi:hypothetical protein
MVEAEWERLSLPMYPGMTAIIDHCAGALPVSIVALHRSDMADGTAVRKVMAWAQLMAQMECPQASTIELKAMIDGKQVYKGTARKADGWVLVEVKPTKSKSQEKVSQATPAKAKVVAKDIPGSNANTVAQPEKTPGPPSESNKSPQSPPVAQSMAVPVNGQVGGAVKQTEAVSQPPTSNDDQQYSHFLEQIRLSAEKGDANAQFLLGNMYADGRGVVRDQQQAASWYRKSAEQGNAAGQLYLAMMYLDGKSNQDQQQAASWIRKSAEQGNADAQYLLGMMYGEGRGVAKDQQQAASWILKAATQGQVMAQSRIGTLYLRGEGVAQDQEQAVFWYRKAASQGDARAQQVLNTLQSK